MTVTKNNFLEELQMSMMDEFKQFALKGNVMDLAVGVIIGGAFGKIVDSMVGDVIMPIVGKIFGGLDFSNMYIGLNGQEAGMALAEAKKAGAVLAYGNFITIVLNFLILAFIIFQMVRIMNKMKKAEPPAAPAPTPEDVILLREIRDSLKK
jgi:large conductance mechanosensitive channel